ncbi:MAG: hypothetical protein WC764_03020 [Candidatus Paceibacterota bacterium]|jgi:hypothetical protein
MLSHNLRHKSYVLRNKQLTKEEYEKEKPDIGSFKIQCECEAEFAHLRSGAVTRFASVTKSENTTGDYITNSKNIYRSFGVDNAENIRYGSRATYIKDSMDVHGVGSSDGAVELLYEFINGGYKDSRMFFSANSYEGMLNAYYCDYCRGSENVFGCVGLKKKQYCILNKQYLKEEYLELVSKIIEHMNKMPYVDASGIEYKYGEFFPSEIAPFTYNESLAQEYFPIRQDVAETAGYRWRKQEEKSYRITILSSALPDHINDTPDSILKEVIGCEHRAECSEQCTGAYKITPAELNFHRANGVALSRLCMNCRHSAQFKKRTPMQLWHRHCMKKGCPNEFETSYAPDRPEIIYCESCYQQEVV